MVVARQLEVPGTGYVDLVGVDSEGGITLVECKLRANPEIRRSVIGQVFAYAAGLWRMSYDQFDQRFAARTGQSLVERIAPLVPGEWDEEAFRVAVTANLAEGNLRLVIAVDQITDELKQTVLFLNSHTVADVRVLALELGYIADHGVEILVPATYGEESARTKALSSKKLWNEADLLDALEQACSPAGFQAMRHLYDSAKRQGAGLNWGRGTTPSVGAQFMVAKSAVTVWVCYAYPDNPVLEISFRYMASKQIPEARLIRFAAALRSIAGVAERLAGLEQAGFKRGPSLPINQVLVQSNAVDIIESAITELVKD